MNNIINYLKAAFSFPASRFSKRELSFKASYDFQFLIKHNLMYYNERLIRHLEHSLKSSRFEKISSISKAFDRVQRGQKSAR